MNDSVLLCRMQLMLQISLCDKSFLNFVKIHPLSMCCSYGTKRYICLSIFSVSLLHSWVYLPCVYRVQCESYSLKSLIHNEDHNDAATFFHTVTLFKEDSSNSSWIIKAHLSFLPYSRDKHPTITLSILRAHNIHGKSGNDIWPVYWL